MKVDRQLSFHAGELDPGLHGRIDLDIYRYGSYRLRDFIVTREGNARNRPGTQHVTTLPGAPKSPLFTYDNGDTRHVWCTVEGFWYIFSVPWLPSVDAWSVKRAVQYGKAVFFTQSDGPPKLWQPEYAGYSHEEIKDAVIKPETPSLIARLPRKLPYGGFKEYPKIRPQSNANYSLGFSGNSTHPLKPWVWAVTYIIEDGITGRYWESAPALIMYKARQASDDGDPAGFYAVSSNVGAYVGGDVPWKIDCGIEPGSAIGFDSHPTSNSSPHIVRGIRVYRGLWQGPSTIVPSDPFGEDVYGNDIEFPVLGLVGSATGRFFIDDGRDPDYSRTPPRREDPYATDYPQAVCLHHGRLVLAGTPKEPMRVRLSDLDRLGCFDEATLALDGELRDTATIDFPLSSKRYDKILDCLSTESGLLIFTASSVYLVRGSGEGEVIRPSSVRPDRIAYFGAADVPVAEGHDAVFFVHESGSRVMALSRQGIVDITVNARHLFRGYTVSSIAFANTPHPVLWAARSDGVLLSCTYMGSSWAWTRHTHPGEVKYLAVIPDGEEDEVYLVANYSGTYCIEKMAKREFTDIRDAVFLDRSVTYDGKTERPSSITESSGTYTLNLNIVVGSPFGTGLEDRFVRFELDDGTFLLFRTVEETGPKIYNAELMAGEVPASMKGAVTNFSSYYLCADSVTGLNHLEGQDVVALVDGSVVRGLTVSGGSVALPVPGGKVHVGLAYTPEWQSLGIAQDAKQQKAVVEAYVRVKDTLGGVIGETLTSDMLEEIAGREASDGYGALDPKTKEYQVPIESGWGQEGYVAYRQNDPLPVTLVGVTRLYQEGGQ